VGIGGVYREGWDGKAIRGRERRVGSDRVEGSRRRGTRALWGQSGRVRRSKVMGGAWRAEGVGEWDTHARGLRCGWEGR